MRNDYDNGLAFGRGYASSYGPHEASSAVRTLNRRGGSSLDYLAGMVDGVLDYVQTREELAPGCYRVRPR